MKQRDRILFLTPLAAAFLVLLFAGLFVHQLNLFENSFFANANNSIRQETALVAAILLPLLNEGRLEEAVAFCNDFDRDSLRLSLIRPDGTVEADSVEKAGFLGNHLERDEVQAALRGNPICTTRFSESLNLWMTYHALKLQTAHGDFIVRAAVSTDKAARIITLAKRTVYLALLFGAALVSLLTAYILSKVRRPLRALQNSLANISRGDLDTRIPVPADGIVRDIALGVAEMTAQLKKHLAEMTRERNIREDILDAMTEAVLLLNADGEAQKINQSGRTMFKIPPGGKFNIARSGINGLLPSLHQTLQTGKPFEQEFNLTEVNGSRILLVKCCCLAPDGKPGLLLTISDLTGIRRLEAFRSDFIANVSHELKTPLTCIIGAAEAIRESTDLPRERLERYIDMLYTQSLRLSLLVQDILSLSALEKRQRDSQKDFMPLDLQDVLVNAVRQCGPEADNAHISLRITASAALETSGDAQLLEQAVQNLISNAIKYSGSQKVELSLTRIDNDAIIAVQDYGVGIAPEHQPRIFERFYRVHKERSRKLGGTGLGLAIVKHIAALHGGKAELQSKPGQGCLFQIILPLTTIP